MANAPLRDRGHEALRQDILATVAAQQQTADDTATGLDLTDVLFDLASSLLTQVGDALTQIDALQQRVAKLENPLAP